MDHAAYRELPKVLPELFADAARRAQQADSMASSCTTRTRTRWRRFFRAPTRAAMATAAHCEGRVRLPLEVLAAVRAAVGDEFVVGCRISPRNASQAAAKWTMRCGSRSEFAAAGMDFLSLSRGGKFDDAKQPKVGRGGLSVHGPQRLRVHAFVLSRMRTGPFGRNLPRLRANPCGAMRAAGLPRRWSTAGGIHNFAQAEARARDGRGRHRRIRARRRSPIPTGFAKCSSGAGAQVRLCLYTNYCEALDQRHREVTCELWDREGLDTPGVDALRGRQAIACCPRIGRRSDIHRATKRVRPSGIGWRVPADLRLIPGDSSHAIRFAIWRPVAFATSTCFAQSNDLATINRIIDEGFNHSELPQTAQYLTDRIGGRMTNSPQMRAAEKWTQEKYRRWGLKNVHAEGFDFGRGWSIERFSVRMVDAARAAAARDSGGLDAFHQRHGQRRHRRGAHEARAGFRQMERQAARQDRAGRQAPARDPSPTSAGFQRYSDEDLDKLDEYRSPAIPRRRSRRR